MSKKIKTYIYFLKKNHILNMILMKYRKISYCNNYLIINFNLDNEYYIISFINHHNACYLLFFIFFYNYN